MDKSSDATVGVGLHGSRCGDAYALVVGATPCHISLKHLLRVTLDEFADYETMNGWPLPQFSESRGLDKLAATHFLVNELDYEILGRHVDEWVLGPKK